jgi:hypothetical protein
MFSAQPNLVGLSSHRLKRCLRRLDVEGSARQVRSRRQPDIQRDAEAQHHGPETHRLYTTVAPGYTGTAQDGRYRAGNGVAQAISPLVPHVGAGARASRGAAA